MRDSKYYKDKYKQAKKKVEKYEDSISDLNKILSSLSDDMYDDIRSVNNKIDDLKTELLEGVRHNSKFTNNANAILSEKEKATSADLNLKVVIQCLEDEIRTLNGKKGQAESDRNSYKAKYDDAKKQERDDFWDSIF